MVKIDNLIKSRKYFLFVIPAKAGIQTLRKTWIQGQARHKADGQALPAIADPLSPYPLRM